MKGLHSTLLAALLVALPHTSLGAQEAISPPESGPASGPASGPISGLTPALDTAGADESGAPMMFRLYSGQVVWGSLGEHSPEGIEVQRLDTGGLARLPWSFLDPTQSEELRLLYGYIEAEGEELLVDAMRIRLVSGREVIGIIDGRSDEFLYLRTSGARLPIPLANLVGAPSTVKVPALDIFSKEELYQRKAQELAGPLAQEGTNAAVANVELAEYAENLFDYTHAVDHFRRAAEEDPSHRSEFVTAAITRTAEKAALQEQVDYLGEIDRLRSRRRFADALAMLEQFNEVFPSSPLRADWNRMRERVAVHQERTLREEVVRQWHMNAVKMTRDMVRKSETYEEVLAAIDGELIESIEARLVEDLEEVAPGITTDEVRRFWEERGKGRIRSASFGLGTWLLGEDRALNVPKKEGKENEAQAGGSGARSDARRDLEDRLGRYMRNQQVQQRSQGGQADDGAESPEDFWKHWSSSSRAQWALSYLVEFSGDFEVARVRLSNCRECGGTGAKQVVYTGSAIADSNSGNQIFRCSVCHGLGRVRRIQYR